jgi:hypothetical protein
MSHEKLQSSSERLMPGGTLTICFEIKIFPSVATVTHGSLQSVAPPPTRAVGASTQKNIFEDMVDNFVNMKLNSVLIVFMDGQQKCHAFPLAARNAFDGKVLIFSGHAFESKRDLPVRSFITITSTVLSNAQRGDSTVLKLKMEKTSLFEKEIFSLGISYTLFFELQIWGYVS